MSDAVKQHNSFNQPGLHHKNSFIFLPSIISEHKPENVLNIFESVPQ